jgi:integration host factor subunit alpha
MEEGLMAGKTLTKDHIVNAIYASSGRHRQEVKAQVEDLLSLMKEAVKNDYSLLISGFGKFEAYDKKARRGRNPVTRESITLPPRTVCVFRLSRKLRSELNPQQHSGSDTADRKGASAAERPSFQRGLQPR